MSADTPVYTPDHPCRCGYDGMGEHQCHAGRDARYPGPRCRRAGTTRWVAYGAVLAGAQI